MLLSRGNLDTSCESKVCWNQNSKKCKVIRYKKNNQLSPKTMTQEDGHSMAASNEMVCVKEKWEKMLFNEWYLKTNSTISWTELENCYK